MNKEKVEQALATYGNRLCKEISRTWDSLQSVDGEANINFSIINSNDKNTTIGRIEATGQKAWLIEYGKGSLMARETDNPYLHKYKNNVKRWNVVRKGHFVTGRVVGSYQDLDNNTYISGGRGAGKSMERIYKPIKPYFVVKKNVTKNSAIKEIFKHSLKNIIKSQLNIEVKNK